MGDAAADADAYFGKVLREAMPSTRCPNAGARMELIYPQIQDLIVNQ